MVNRWKRLKPSGLWLMRCGESLSLTQASSFVNGEREDQSLQRFGNSGIGISVSFRGASLKHNSSASCLTSPSHSPQIGRGVVMRSAPNGAGTNQKSNLQFLEQFRASVKSGSHRSEGQKRAVLLGKTADLARPADSATNQEVASSSLAGRANSRFARIGCAPQSRLVIVAAATKDRVLQARHYCQIPSRICRLGLPSHSVTGLRGLSSAAWRAVRVAKRVALSEENPQAKSSVHSEAASFLRRDVGRTMCPAWSVPTISTRGESNQARARIRPARAPKRRGATRCERGATS
jgi:hypothetical protein